MSLLLLVSCLPSLAYDSTDKAQVKEAQDNFNRQAVINDPELNSSRAALDFINNPGNVYSQRVLQQINEMDYDGARETEIQNYLNGD